MRIIGSLDHPTFKITVFKMDNRLSLKIENAQYEQTYKLGDDDRFGNLDAVNMLADPEFLKQVQAIFNQMHRSRLEAMGRAFPPDTTEHFEEIV